MTALVSHLRRADSAHGYDLVALHAPVLPLLWSVYEPDMLPPATVPVYVTTPTVPKLIEVPETVPVIFSVSDGDESTIVPLSAMPVCVHVSENVPVCAPLY